MEINEFTENQWILRIFKGIQWISKKSNGFQWIIYGNPLRESAGRPQRCPKLAGRAPALENSEILKNRRNPRGPKFSFFGATYVEKMFWLRWIISQSLIQNHVEFPTVLNPSPPNERPESRSSGQPPKPAPLSKSLKIVKIIKNQ